MSKSYADITKQIAELQAEAASLRQKEVGDVVGKIKEAIKTYGLTAADLGLNGVSAKASPGRRRRGVAKKAAAKGPRRSSGAKYGDGSGNTWGGRGPRPRWLRDALASGKKLEDFAA